MEIWWTKKAFHCVIDRSLPLVVLFLPAAVPPQNLPSSSMSLAFLVALGFCLCVMYSIVWAYRSACTTRPGFVASFALDSSLLARDDLEALNLRWDSHAATAKRLSRWVDDGSIPNGVVSTSGRQDAAAEEDDHWPRVKMCYKCPPIPLWKALAYLPPELREVEKRKRLRRKKNDFSDNLETANAEATSSLRSRGSSPSAAPDASCTEPLKSKLPVQDKPQRSRFTLLTSAEEDEVLSFLRESILSWLPSEQACSMVPPPKPERSHHCSICKTCVIKYDHHCPWLNQCVGLHNERYFLLFLLYLVTGCCILNLCGWSEFYKAAKLLVLYDNQDRTLFGRSFPLPVPRAFVLLTYVLSLVMGFALALMGGGHAVMVAKGQTSVESTDAPHYVLLAQKRGRKFANVYDLGSRAANLQLFFYVPEGECSSYDSSPSRRSQASSGPASPSTGGALGWLRSLAPVRRSPYSDGWHWAKRKGLRGVNAGIIEEEELTDDEYNREDSGPVPQPVGGEVSLPT